MIAYIVTKSDWVDDECWLVLAESPLQAIDIVHGSMPGHDKSEVWKAETVDHWLMQGRESGHIAWPITMKEGIT